MEKDIYVIWNAVEDRPAIGGEFGALLCYAAEDNAKAFISLQKEQFDRNFIIKKFKIVSE